MGDVYMRFNILFNDLLMDKYINAPINLFPDIKSRSYIINILRKDLSTGSKVNIILFLFLRIGFQYLDPLYYL